MVNLYFLIFGLILTKPIKSVDIKCKYEIGNRTDPSSIYYCDVQNQLNLTSTKSSKINSALGFHEGGKSSDDVSCFFAHDKNLQIFPKGLDKIFKNLKRIDIYIGRLKELRQKDLKVFPQLTELDLWSNDIQVLESDIFSYNPFLTYINLSHNKLIHIDENVFKWMTNLMYLGLHSNPCVSKTASNDTKQLANLIDNVKATCINQKFLKMKAKLEDLEDEYKYIEIEEISGFKDKVDAFQLKYQDSGSINIPSIKERIHQLSTLWNFKKQQESKDLRRVLMFIGILFYFLNQTIVLAVIFIKIVNNYESLLL